MRSSNQDTFFSELDQSAKMLEEYLLTNLYLDRFKPEDMRKAVTLYVRSGGKRLRPAILLWSCGALGGDVETALPAAAAVEIFHTWTLVHDDIIDRDDKRRGGHTVHEHFRKHASERLGAISSDEQNHYGISVAILAGDVQHGWGVSMMTELSSRKGLDPAVTLHLINRLDDEVLNMLVEGEVLDIQFSQLPLSQLKLKTIEDMLWKKTGVLYRFCAAAGSLIGLGRVEPDHPTVTALEEFSSLCGVAFQLQDDLLGITGDPVTIGKPVGSDIREGKRTTVVYYAYQEADRWEKERIEEILGRSNASEAELNEVISILKRRGGIEKTQERARYHIENALPLLDELPPSRYLELLNAWADFMIAREW